jgi:hypothetical protein
VSEDAQRLSLFTGELADVGRPWTIPPLSYAESASGIGRFSYAGPLVTFPTHTPFLDLERGLAGGTLAEGQLDLTFAPDFDAQPSVERFGDVRGTLAVDGRAYSIATRGLATYADGPMRPRFPSCRVTFSVGATEGMTLTADGDEFVEWADELLRATFVTSPASSNGRLRVRMAGEVRLGDACGEILLRAPHGSGWEPLHGTLERLLPVRRPGPFGSVVETVFAVVRMGGQSVGWLELSVLRAPDGESSRDDVGGVSAT